MSETGNREPWVPFDRTGFTSIAVLPFLCGYPLDDIAFNYVASLRPSCYRVIGPDGLTKSDAVCWRVTIHMGGPGPQARIVKIEQEVAVELRGGFEHGHALDCARRERASRSVK